MFRRPLTIVALIGAILLSAGCRDCCHKSAVCNAPPCCGAPPGAVAVPAVPAAPVPVQAGFHAGRSVSHLCWRARILRGAGPCTDRRRSLLSSSSRTRAGLEPLTGHADAASAPQPLPAAGRAPTRVRLHRFASSTSPRAVAVAVELAVGWRRR